jgi:(4S)-4-hydroxy-5-phosphonooxypentane-2,3-dione isomerase
MSQIAILARVTVKKGKTGQYLAALAPLLEQARKEPGTLLYAVHRSADDPDVFWTTEIYANDEAFAAHRATDTHADAAPVFTDLIAGAEVTVGETVMATGLDR